MAVSAAKAVGYVSAGTVEFLRGPDGSFYFMEMNTRLQVEHPVTEMTVGLDLVRAMILIAAGQRLPIRQDDVEIRGHAIECRIIAEDPSRNFLPGPGTIRGLRAPAGPGIRYDDGIYAGYTVPVHYDALLSKLVAWGKDRDEAIARMARALDEYRIDGLRTTIPFHRWLMRHDPFVAGDLDTEMLARDWHPSDELPPDLAERVAVLAAISEHLGRGRRPIASTGATEEGGRWLSFARRAGLRVP